MSDPESDYGISSFFYADHFFSYYNGYCNELEAGVRHPPSNNDDITHTLQEGMSRLSITGESSQSSTNVQPRTQTEYPQSSFGVQPWHIPRGNYYDGNYGVLEDIDNVGPSSSSYSSGERNNHGEEQNYSLEIIHESEVDNGIDRNLNEMNAIPHTPQTNGDIPPVDDAMSDHERLLNRLRLSGFVENKVEGDGNCQFRALSDQLYQTPKHHRYVRKQIVKQLKDHPEMYEGYVDMAYCDYLKKMMKDGEWGDNVTLQAAADLYGIKILIITSFKDTWNIEITPKTKKSTRVVYLSFMAEVHYNSICFVGGEGQGTVECWKQESM